MTLETAAAVGVELATESPAMLKVTGVQQSGAQHRLHISFFPACLKQPAVQDSFLHSAKCRLDYTKIHKGSDMSFPPLFPSAASPSISSDSSTSGALTAPSEEQRLSFELALGQCLFGNMTQEAMLRLCRHFRLA